MKEFRLLPIVLLLAYAVPVNAAPAVTKNSETQIKPGHSTTEGRFQLFQGLVTINAQGTPFNDPGVFKIDSVTGRTWKYEEGRTKDGQFYKQWVPIEQAP